MSDFLTRIVQRQRNEMPAVQPRTRSMFAPTESSYALHASGGLSSSQPESPRNAEREHESEAREASRLTGMSARGPFFSQQATLLREPRFGGPVMPAHDRLFVPSETVPREWPLGAVMPLPDPDAGAAVDPRPAERRAADQKRRMNLENPAALAGLEPRARAERMAASIVERQRTFDSSAPMQPGQGLTSHEPGGADPALRGEAGAHPRPRWVESNLQSPIASRRPLAAPPSLLLSESLPRDMQRESQRSPDTSVHVTIGRIEVTAGTPPAAAKRVSAPRKASMSLQDYLARRKSSKP